MAPCAQAGSVSRQQEYVAEEILHVAEEEILHVAEQKQREKTGRGKGETWPHDVPVQRRI